jgi:hypothetical protein
MREVVERDQQRRVTHFAEGDLCREQLRSWMARVKRPCAVPWLVICRGTGVQTLGATAYAGRVASSVGRVR